MLLHTHSSSCRSAHARWSRFGWQLLGALAMVATLLAGARTAWSDEGSIQVPLLVANPKIDEGVLRHVVVAVAKLPDGVLVGVIVNRPTENRLAQLFPNHEPSGKVSDPVYFGGPYSPNAIVALVRSGESPGGHAFPFAPGVFLAVDAPTVDLVIERHPDQARFFVGYILWSPSTLQDELAAGVWVLRHADASTIFRKNTESLWRELMSPGIVAARGAAGRAN